MSAKRPPIKLTWHDALVDWLATGPPGMPQHSPGAVLAVASARMRHASSNGTECYPTREWLAQLLGYHVDTVRAVDRFLEANGWLVQTGTKGRQRTPVYRLTDASMKVPVSTTGTATATRRVHPSMHQPPYPRSETEGEGVRDADALRGASLRAGPDGPRGDAEGQTMSAGMNGAAAAHADDGEPGDDEPATDAEWYLIRTVDVLAPGVDADNPKITGHVRRLAAGGWTPDLVTRAWLPPGREIRNPTRLALWELGRLKTDPSRQRVLQLREGRASSEVPQCQSCGRWDDKTDEPLGGPPGVWTHSYTAHDGTWSADYCASCIGHEGQAYADDRDEAVTFTHRITGETRIFEPALLDDEPAPARVPWPDEFDPDTQGALAQEGPIHERKIE